jgi:hypothetical protein
MLLNFNTSKLEWDCPPPPVMEGCERIGIIAASAGGWSRVSEVGTLRSGWLGHLATRFSSNRGHAGKRREAACTCGEHIVLLVKYRFTLDTGEQLDYWIGQCERCQTILWDD